jgi:hypothetical protein
MCSSARTFGLIHLSIKKEQASLDRSFLARTQGKDCISAQARAGRVRKKTNGAILL